jgi:hypothetical protein
MNPNNMSDGGGIFVWALASFAWAAILAWALLL